MKFREKKNRNKNVKKKQKKAPSLLVNLRKLFGKLFNIQFPV